MFVPMQMLEAGPASGAASPLHASHDRSRMAAPSIEASRIEIALPDGTCIRVGADIGLVALRRVIAAVRR
ncbi:MAG: hypothetical protein M3Y41_16605 [Pseudomonadota bacterium]|nr:hypothetical protein [Pseudomonadota bacterium]